jgi:hypothetical protein
MRTALYVHQPTSVTIRASDAIDRACLLVPFRGRTPRQAVGTHQLPPGIYLIESQAPLEITGPGTTVETTSGTKDPWPTPKAAELALESGASVEAVQQFFMRMKEA